MVSFRSRQGSNQSTSCQCALQQCWFQVYLSTLTYATWIKLGSYRSHQRFKVEWWKCSPIKDLNFVKLLFPLREWRQKLTSSMVQPKLCSTNTVENNHRHQHDIKHNASLSTRFLLYRSTKPKKGVRHTFNIYLYNASQSYTIQTMLINLRQSQLEEKQPSLPEQIIFWLHSSWYLFFCFRSPVHFRPSTLQRPATAEGQGHLKQCPKARRSINRRSLLSSFCNSLPMYLSFYVNHWTWMSMI